MRIENLLPEVPLTMTRLIDVVFDMDKMLGPDFEAGLAQLKAVAEK